jgi:hypothetical protein
MYGVCTEDWHPRDVAWCDRDHAFNAFLPDCGARMRLCDNSFHVVSHVWPCIETLHRPLPPPAPRSIDTVTLLVRHAMTSNVNRRRTVLSRPICELSTYGCVRDGRERLPPSLLSFSVIISDPNSRTAQAACDHTIRHSGSKESVIPRRYWCGELGANGRPESVDHLGREPPPTGDLITASACPITDVDALLAVD